MLAWIVSTHRVVASAPPHHSEGAIRQSADLPKPLSQSIKAGRLRLIKSFQAKAGLHGYLVERHGRYGVLYGFHGYLLAGQLISPDGRNLSDVYARRYMPVTSLASIVGMLKAKGRMVTLGAKGQAPTLYVFEDPNCIYCHRLDEMLKPFLKSGKLKMDVILVGLLKASSMAKTVAILRAKNPQKAFWENEKKFNLMEEEGGIPAATSLPARLVKVIKFNQTMMMKAGFNGTPGLIYKNHSGKWISINGLPPEKDLTQMIHSVS